MRLKAIFGLLALAVTVLGGDVALADSWIQQTPLGYQQITSLSGATHLTVPTGATQAVIFVEAQAVRFRDDGTAPTATVGAPLGVTGAGLPYVYNGTLSAIQFIEQTSSAKLDILYYR